MKKMKKISRCFSMLLAIALLLGCMPSMQIFAAKSAGGTVQSIWTTDGTNTTYEELPFSPSSYEYQNISTQQMHYYKDITLNLNFRGAISSAPTIKVEGHDFTSFTYDNSGTMLEIALKNVQAYASPSNNNWLSIEINYAGNKVHVFVNTFYSNVDTSKPYLAGRDMWDFDNEQLPDVYSPVVIAQKAHRYTYSFTGALIMPDSESFQVTLDGEIMTGATVTRKNSLGYGMSLYEFSLYPFPYTFNVGPDGYSTVDFIGTTSAGYTNHVLLKCRFVYR